jgi:hypothetical protein
MRHETLQEEKRAQQRKRKTKPTTQTTTKGPVSNHKKKNNKMCETCDPTKVHVHVFNNTPQRKTPWRREGERAITLTAIHICHRSRIPV